MHRHLWRYLAVSLSLLLALAIAAAAQTTEPPAATAPASEPAPKLHCVVVNEASAAVPKTEVLVHGMGAAGWVPINGQTAGKAGECDLPFPGNTPGLLRLTITAPGYQDADVYFLPDPQKVIPWISITLKGAKELAGTVVTEDEKPVADAVVTLENPAGRRQVKTDAEGRFTLKELMPVRASVTVEVPGVGNGSYQVNMAKQTEPITIVIRPQRRVTLRVVDSDSKPVPNLAVQILGPHKAEGRTDAEGRMPVPGLGTDAAQVRVSLDDKFYCFDEPVLKLEVDEGEEPVELEVYATHGGRISGQVVEMVEGGEAEGIPAASVWLVDGGRMGKTVLTDEDGNFELNAVAADSYVVAAGHPTYATSLGQAEIEAGKEVKLKFTLSLGATIHGTVVDPAGKPVERAIVRVVAWYPKGQKQPDSGEPLAIELPWRGTRSAADGEYLLEHLPAGRFTIEAAAQDGAHRTVLNLQVTQGQEVIESKIVLQSGSFKPPI